MKKKGVLIISPTIFHLLLLKDKYKLLLLSSNKNDTLVFKRMWLSEILHFFGK